MDTTISIEHLAKELESILCSENKGHRKYAKAWLSHEDFGGLYDAEKYILNIQAEHRIESCFDETRNIITLLHKKLDPVSLSLIWRVVVYNAFERPHCWIEDFELKMNTAC